MYGFFSCKLDVAQSIKHTLIDSNILGGPVRFFFVGFYYYYYFKINYNLYSAANVLIEDVQFTPNARSVQDRSPLVAPILVIIIIMFDADIDVTK